MPRFIDVAGCPCPAELAPFVREVMHRTGVAPVTIYRGSEPEALKILHAHGKHSQAELRAAYDAGHAAQFGIRGVPDLPGTSTHELRSDGRAFPHVPSGQPIEPVQCGMDWPIANVPHVLEEFTKLGCAPIRPYGSAATEAQHICCTKAGKLGPLALLASNPLSPGDKGPLVRDVQLALVKAGLLPADFEVAEHVGTYGPHMVDAVKQFQRQHDLDVDGVIGDKTFAALVGKHGHHHPAPDHDAPAPPHDEPAPPHHDGKRRLSAHGLHFIKRFEGFRDTIYDDGRGVMTIGYGETRQPLPQHITEPEAAKLLARRLDADYEPAVRALFHGPQALPFNQHRYDALVSFVYNLGPNAVKGGPGFETIGRAIHGGNLAGIAEAMPLYSNPNDPAVHAGLLRRRKAEAAMFLTPVQV